MQSAFPQLHIQKPGDNFTAKLHFLHKEALCWQQLPVQGGAGMQQFELERLKNSDIEQSSSDRLVDLRSVTINKATTVPERLASYMEQIKNPYLFKVNDITVKLEFSPGKTLEESLMSFMLAERNR